MKYIQNALQSEIFVSSFFGRSKHKTLGSSMARHLLTHNRALLLPHDFPTNRRIIFYIFSFLLVVLVIVWNIRQSGTSMD